MAKAVLVDVGGVLVHANWHDVLRRWEPELGAPPDQALAAMFRGFDDTVLIGRRAAEEHWKEAEARLGLGDGRIWALIDDLAKSESLDTELLTFIAALRPRYKTAIVSNGWTDFRTAQRRRDLDELVDEVVISAEVGVAKPSRRIFEIALDRLGVAANDAVFVDDHERHLAAARTLGLQTVRYETAQQVVAALSNLLETSTKP